MLSKMHLITPLSLSVALILSHVVSFHVLNIVFWLQPVYLYLLVTNLE